MGVDLKNVKYYSKIRQANVPLRVESRESNSEQLLFSDPEELQWQTFSWLNRRATSGSRAMFPEG